MALVVAAVPGPAAAVAQLLAVAGAVALEVVAAVPLHPAVVEAVVLEPVPAAPHRWAAHLADSGKPPQWDSAPLPAAADQPW